MPGIGVVWPEAIDVAVDPDLAEVVQLSVIADEDKVRSVISPLPSERGSLFRNRRGLS